jgi:hypothetical protein
MPYKLRAYIGSGTVKVILAEGENGKYPTDAFGKTEHVIDTFPWTDPCSYPADFHGARWDEIFWGRDDPVQVLYRKANLPDNK